MSNSVSVLNPAQLRAETAKRLWRIIKYDLNESIDAVLTPQLENYEQQAWMSAAIYGCCRFYPRYENQLIQLLKKPIKPNEGEVKALFILGMHQLSAMQVKAHAAINETVNACRVLDKDWAIKLVNGVLRNYQRSLAEQKFKTELTQYAHPKWMIKMLKNDWPNKWRDVLEANNKQAPMSLRVNTQKHTRKEAIQKLAQVNISASMHSELESAIVLEKAVNVEQLPGFFEGHFSVQDVAAQYSAELLISEGDRAKKLRVLDACAAPGGKTGHLLERLSLDSSLVAVDVSQKRLQLVHDNLDRLGFSNRENLQVICADAANLSIWKSSDKSHLFDRILLAAPCSAPGVIRRHPDIKFRRSLKHLEQLYISQYKILDALWSFLRPGGKLLYATCSIFKNENQYQIEKFIQSQVNAKVLPLSLAEADNSEFGSQILSGSMQRDGFFYAVLEKT